MKRIECDCCGKQEESGVLFATVSFVFMYGLIAHVICWAQGMHPFITILQRLTGY